MNSVDVCSFCWVRAMRVNFLDGAVNSVAVANKLPLPLMMICPHRDLLIDLLCFPVLSSPGFFVVRKNFQLFILYFRT